MRKFSALIMITPLVLASIGMPTAADACEILETRMTRSSLFVNEDASKWEIAASASGTTSDALNVAKCKGGYLQVSLGATLPHPQSYAGLMFTGADFQRAPVCTITDDSSSATSRGSIAFGETVRKFQSLARNCVGITVEEPSGQPVDLVSSVACEVASKNANSSVVTLKGDNCLFKPSKAGMRIYPAILKSCQNELAATDLRELDLTLNLQFAMDLKGETSPDGLAAKPIHVVFSAKKSPHVVRPSSSPKSNTAFKVSSQYAARVSLAQFSLRGSTETGLLADANYLIERSENDPAGNYRLPLVVKNELYLVQAGNSSQHIGTWFNGSIVPAG
ncbi:MAG: hypothetical protein V4692_12125, partial [Bdellovibrionota bacterium]